MARTPETFRRVQTLRKRYYEMLPGKEALLRVLGEAEIPEHVYDSNAIENSTLSLEETEKILLRVDLDRYVSEREIFEAKNLARVAEYIETKATETDISFSIILDLHRMLIGNIRDEIAGRFRKDDEWVRVGAHIGAAPSDIEQLLTEALTAFVSDPREHIIRRVARFHLAFEHIHPFVDGNGRIGRVLNNYLLIREGYVPINIAFVNRSDYYDAFREYDMEDKTGIMESIVGRALAESYHKRLAYMEGKRIVTLREHAKVKHLPHSNLINKANRQTIPAFREKGIWKIGT